MTWSASKYSRQYLAHEEGTVKKDWGGKLPVALVYPNTYYLGMSNLGIHSIYTLLNSQPDIVCERVFWNRYEDKKQIPISIESQRGLAEFAIIAFSITYELDFFNIPHILAAAGIPPLAAERDSANPLIIAGGACITANPMPIAPFFDCLGIGEAEVILPDLLKMFVESRDGNREDKLELLSHIPGIYVPSVPQKKVKRQWVTNLDNYPTHTAITTQDTELGNLFLIEVARGCRWGCRFCMVCEVFRPMRVHSFDSLIEQAKIGLKSSKRLGLVGPNVTDHPQFEDLLNGLKDLGTEISVSSLRIKPLFPSVIEELAGGGTGTVAFAPEAGSDRLRTLIHKGINEDDVLRAVHTTAKYRMKQLRLYFMIGLPTETEEDIQAIVDLSKKCKHIIEKEQSNIRMTISISSFVPKASTPFQWMPMERLSVLERRLTLLKTRLRPSGIKVVGESPAWSKIQATLARGDQKLALALNTINKVSLHSWEKTLEKSGLCPDDVYERWDQNKSLPWGMIDSGTEPEYFTDSD